MNKVEILKIFRKDGRLYVEIQFRNISKKESFKLYAFNVCGDGGVMFKNFFNVKRLGKDGSYEVLKYRGIVDFVGQKIEESDFLSLEAGELLKSQCDITVEYGGYSGELQFQYKSVNPSYDFNQIIQQSEVLVSTEKNFNNARPFLD